MFIYSEDYIIDDTAEEKYQMDEYRRYIEIIQ